MPARTDPPLWLLDVDGVVNVLARGAAPDSWPADQWLQRVVVAPIEGRGLMRLPILAARPVLEFITRTHESGAAEIRWHSTWRFAAVTHLAPVLGLPPLPVSVAPEWQHGGDLLWWKLPAALRAVAAGRRLVWTDDDLQTYADLGDADTASALAALAQDDDTLLISTSPARGLGPDDLAAIDAWV